MKLDIEQIKHATQGALRVVFQDGKFKFFRFDEQEAKAADNSNSVYTAGIQMEFKTDGDILKLKVNTDFTSSIRSFFSFDIFVDETLIGCIKNFDDENCTGNYSEQSYPLGSFFKEFKLGKGEKSVRIVFPHSVIAEIEEMEIVGSTYFIPIKRKKKIVVYGDSIMQGFDALHPSNTFAMRLADALDAELFNKGIGGDIFNHKIPDMSCDIQADYVFIAYGTNDWKSQTLESFRKNADDFMNSALKKYPSTPIFVITPIWRCDYNINEGKKCGDFFNIEKILIDVCKNYKDITVISGWNLVEHDMNLFGDLKIHPNDEGFGQYSTNLIKSLKLI